MENQQTQNIRNFVIIAHIDHGKSTLADRFLEVTGTIVGDKMKPQFLDMMDLEREKGITIKMQPVRMDYVLNGKSYILNLIDTPGHIDFSYEVSRSLAAVEGAVLLVDAVQGVQAQTLYNLDLARKQNLVIIPAINKIDMPGADFEKNAQELANLLGVDVSEVIGISAKQGTNVKELLEKVIEKVPPPAGDLQQPFSALIFDSKYDSYKGVVAYVRVKNGEIKNEKIYLKASKETSQLKEVGMFRPALVKADVLKAGEIGYIATGIKEPGKVRTGDTIVKSNNTELASLPGYAIPKPMVFVSMYPQNSDDFDLLKEALSKLKLNDAALDFEVESKENLGRGFRCGFLGSLHAEIVSERLKREFGLNLIISTPSVVYKVIDNKDRELLVKSIADWPKEATIIKETQEPWVNLEIMAPFQFMGPIMNYVNQTEADYKDKQYFGQDKVLLTYEMPLREIITGFYDNILRISQGYASMNYDVLGFRPSELVKLEILIAGKREEAFSRIVAKKDAHEEGSRLAKKLKDVLPPQQFAVAIQAVIGGKVVARETLSSVGRDVIAPLYGGDYSRKRKLLEKQKKGKKELKEKGQLSIPPSVFFEIFKK